MRIVSVLLSRITSTNNNTLLRRVGLLWCLAILGTTTLASASEALVCPHLGRLASITEIRGRLVPLLLRGLVLWVGLGLSLRGTLYPLVVLRLLLLGGLSVYGRVFVLSCAYIGMCSRRLSDGLTKLCSIDSFTSLAEMVSPSASVSEPSSGYNARHYNHPGTELSTHLLFLLRRVCVLRIGACLLSR